MQGYSAVINTRADVYHLLDIYPPAARAYIVKIMDERQAWISGEYQDDPRSAFFRLGFTVTECLEIVPEYSDPPIPAPPPSQSEIEALELGAWRTAASCGPLQLRRALRAMGLMPTVAVYLTGAPDEVLEAWEYASEFKRMDPFILAVQAELSRNDAEVDELFRLALTF